MLKKDRSTIEAEVCCAINNTMLPYENIGWPPNIERYIKDIARNVAIAVINSIYTEQELDAEVESILLP
jgi:hypothetical protein